MASPTPSKPATPRHKSSLNPVSTPTAVEKSFRTFPNVVPTSSHKQHEAHPDYPTIGTERPPFRGTQSDPQPSRIRPLPTTLQSQGHRGKRPRTSYADQYREFVVQSRLQTTPKTGTAQENHDTFASEERHNSSTDEHADPSHTDEEESAPKPSVSNPKSKTKPQKYKPQGIHEELRSRLRRAVSHNPEIGVVYILRDENNPHRLKIGATKDFTERHKWIKSNCKIKTDIVEVIGDFQYFFRAEHLIHGDLMRYCRPEPCPGRCKNKQTHYEWFEIDEKQAKATVERWVNFMKLQPYNSMGELKSVWKHILNKRSLKLPNNHSDDEMHQYRWDHWTAILSPPSWTDYYESAIVAFKTDPLVIFISDFFWQFFCVLSWLVTFHVLRNGIVFAALLVSIIGTGISMSFHLPYKVKVWTGKGRKGK